MKGKKKRKGMLLAAVLAICLSGCISAQGGSLQAEGNTEAIYGTAGNAGLEVEAMSGSALVSEETAASEESAAPVLYYQGHASVRITTPEGKAIYLDPYERVTQGYEEAADVILVTDMRHMDHNHLDSVANRKEDCQIYSPENMITEEGHRRVELGYVTIEAVEAGYNQLHDPQHCVGYILEFPNGASVYFTGDTAITPQMASLAERNLDYAFFCCDGIYTMTMEQAKEAAELVQAWRSIPYHMSIDELFDRETAELFDVDGRLILEEGKEMALEPEPESEEETGSAPEDLLKQTLESQAGAIAEESSL